MKNLLIWIHIIIFVSKLIFFDVIQQKISFETKFEIVIHSVACNAYLPHPYWMPKHEFQTPWGELAVGPHENSDFVQSFSNSCLTFARFSPLPILLNHSRRNYFERVIIILIKFIELNYIPRIKNDFMVAFRKDFRIESVFRYIFILSGWWKGRKLQAHCFLQEIIARKTSLRAPT